MAGVLAAQRDRLRARVAQLNEAVAQVCKSLCRLKTCIGFVPADMLG